MRSFSFAAAAASILLCGCVSTRQPAHADGTELIGRVVQVEMPGGGTTMLRFNADGTVRGSSAAGEATGQWTAVNGQLCTDWPRLGRECYPYTRAFRRGETVTLTGTSGATAQVTLQ